MKKLLLTVIALACLCTLTFGKQPPAAVKATLAQKFPGATKISWDKEGMKKWEAEFVFEGSMVKADFEKNGTWLQTENKIAISDLPKSVTDAIHRDYPKWTVVAACTAQSSKHGSVYGADLKKGGMKKEVEYRENGAVVKN
jgi:Putative beta-lactamase-inhibitor-like, PepSY-like